MFPNIAATVTERIILPISAITWLPIEVVTELLVVEGGVIDPLGLGGIELADTTGTPVAEE